MRGMSGCCGSPRWKWRIPHPSSTPQRKTERQIPGWFPRTMRRMTLRAARATGSVKRPRYMASMKVMRAIRSRLCYHPEPMTSWVKDMQPPLTHQDFDRAHVDPVIPIGYGSPQRHQQRGQREADQDEDDEPIAAGESRQGRIAASGTPGPRRWISNAGSSREGTEHHTWDGIDGGYTKCRRDK